MELLEDDNTRHWAEPGVYAVAPGVYRIPLPLPHDALRAVNVYAITDGSELALIDSGWALDEARELLSLGLKAIGADLADIGQFLVTHVHRDHYTQAVALRREFGSKVALGEHEEPSLALAADPEVFGMNGQIELLRLHDAQPVIEELGRFFGDAKRTDLDLWEYPDEWLAPGRRSVLPGRELDVIHTPGHTAGHVVFDDGAAGLLFTGDHVLPHITPSIGFQPEPTALPLRDYIGSLKVVRALPDRRMLPAHGAVSPSVHARADALLEHHRDRLEKMGGKILAGASTAYEVALSLGWTRHERKLGDMDAFNQMLAVLETAAHLDLLAADGRLRSSDVDGVRHYSA
ncbi:MBL fold metallo-hydrolase [Amycolatopsis xylanica]|uniref:MBL fold metallo-hydrolase n=1 Tax=Amycolatopsis xylanica TaxID=589385 RepID=UPI000B80BB7E|nr:MBL fold metallo-hydrolase [Amycolatopsis xylanica]